MLSSTARGILTAALAIALAQACDWASAAIYDARDEFEASWSTGKNPSGAWRYGWTNGISSPLRLFTRNETAHVNNNLEHMWDDPDNSLGFTPSVARNSGGNFDDGNVTFTRGALILHPSGIDGRAFAHVIWTAPRDGAVSLASIFFAQQNGISVDVHVLINRDPVFNAAITANGISRSFADDFMVSAGSTIDFAVGPAGNFSLHPGNTGLEATILFNPVPEPSSAAVIAIGVLGVLALMRRRTVRVRHTLASASTRYRLTGWSAAGIMFLMLTSLKSMAAFHQVDFSPQANWSYTAVDVDPTPPPFVHLPSAPEGEVTLGGIPFDIVENPAGKQAWSAFVAGGGMHTGRATLTMNVDIFGATHVYTIINSFFGAAGPRSYASLIFNGSNGARYVDNLIGGVDLRDWGQSSSTNSINNTTTINVFNGSTTCCAGVGRLDMQTITLPHSFASQVLTSIELIDAGDHSVAQRVILDGVTVSSIPEPSSIFVWSLGMTLLLVARLKGLRSSSSAGCFPYIKWGGRFSPHAHQIKRNSFGQLEEHQRHMSSPCIGPER